jgi:hypothetical protein
LYIKVTNLKPKSCADNLFKDSYFYIWQRKLSLDKIFYKIVYLHINYMCDFFLLWFAQVFMKTLVCTWHIVGFKISNAYFIRVFYTL